MTPIILHPILYNSIFLIAITAGQIILAVLIYFIFKFLKKEKTHVCQVFFKVWEKINYILLGALTLMIYSTPVSPPGIWRYIIMAASFMLLFGVQKIVYNNISNKTNYN